MPKVEQAVSKNQISENQDLYLLIAFWAFSVCQKSDAKNSRWLFFENLSSSSKRQYTDTLLKKLNHVFLEKNEFQESATAKSKLKIFYTQEHFGKKIFEEV